MRILALETSGKSGSVAALAGGELLCEQVLDPGKRSAQSLAPGIRGLLAATGWRPADVQFVAVTTGPGSFTGLRVGVTTAKVFAYAVGAGVLGVNTLEVIARQAPADVDRVWAVVDAHRQQLFAGRFARGGEGQMQWVGSTELVEIETWLAALEPGSLVTGPGLHAISDRLPPHASALAPKFHLPAAAEVGRLAWDRHAASLPDDVWNLLPQYFRRSAAEEKADEKLRTSAQ